MTLPRPGDRIRLVAMPDDPDPLPPGSVGTIVTVTKHGAGRDAWLQLDVEWENGRKLCPSGKRAKSSAGHERGR